MNTTVSKSFGLALLLAVGIIAVLVAMGAFTSQRAAAVISPGATIEAAPNTAGAQAEITIKLTESNDLADTNNIYVTFPLGFTVGEPPSTKINGTGISNLTASANGDTDADADDRKLSIDIQTIKDSADSGTRFKGTTEITIEIAKGTGQKPGVTLPAIDGTYKVSITTDLIGGNIVMADLVVGTGVTPPTVCVASGTDSCLTVNPPGAGAASTVTVKFQEAVEDLDVGDEIAIKLEDFGVPSSISASSVLIRGEYKTDEPGSKNPDGVSVSGSTITLIIPDMYDLAGSGDNGLIKGSDITVLIRQSAGITLPTAAGTDYKAEITTTKSPTAKMTDAITIIRELSLSPTSGAKGTSVTASGKGWGSTGPVMLWVDDGAGTTDKKGADNNLRDGLEVILAENVAVSGGAFSATFTADFSEDTKVQARDAAGNTVAKRPEFEVTGSLSLDKDSVKVNEALEITLSEYTDGPVTEVKIGGIEQDRPMTGPTDAPVPPMVDKGSVTFSINVKATTPLGTQVVSVTAGDDPETKTGTVSVAAVPMTISPETAALGQEITISATGFNANKTIQSVRVGGQTVNNDSNNDPITDTNRKTDGNGNITISVVVPHAAGTGERLIRMEDAEGRTGEARIMIPAPTLTLSASESRRNSRVTASGTGFVANDSIRLDYNTGSRDRSVATARTDSVGAWSVQFVVPADAGIGQDHTVTAESSADDKDDKPIVTKTAEHTVPGPDFDLDPPEAASGATIKITGSSFPGYSSVDELTIGTIPLSVTGIQTNAEGAFVANVTVPQLAAGTHNVSVKIGTESISKQLVIPLDTTQAVGDVFFDLIANESLQTIWRYDFDTRTWTSYTTDPETSFANDLFEVESSDILNINVSSEQTFSHQKGSSLFEGWNLITLN